MAWAPPSKVGDTDPTISDAKAKLKAFQYGRDEGLGTTDVNDVYTAGFGRALPKFAAAINAQVRKGLRPSPYVTTTGAYDWTVKAQLGLLPVKPTPPPAAHRPIYLFSAPGSGVNNLVGPPNDAGVRASDVLHINHRRLNFPIGGYLGLMGGDPGLSYNEVIGLEGADLEFQLEQVIRDEGMDPNKPATWAGASIEFWLLGYSQSADGMKKAAARLFGVGGRFEKLRSRINGLILFGDPSRSPGPVKAGAGNLGYNPRGYGIARYDCPAWLSALTWSITTDGDMYACTEDDTLLPGFYRWFVSAETSLSFIEMSAGIVVPAIASYLGIAGPLIGGIFGAAGAAIIGAAVGVGIPFLTQVLNSGAMDDPVIVQLRNDVSAQGLLSVGGMTKLFKTLAALPGVDTHGRYGEPRAEFGGRTGIQVACDIMAGFRR